MAPPGAFAATWPTGDRVEAEGSAPTAPAAPHWHQELAALGRLGDYEVRRVLGSGGMGLVFEAFDPRRDRVVAIKTASDRDRRGGRRLILEARALAAVAHDNVVRVLELGRAGGRPCLVMELVRGLDGAAWIDAAPRSVAEVLDVYLQVGEGLAATHAAGLVHCDVKPSNVLVGDDGRARLADFGLARRHGRATSAHIIGTPGFAAPEQLRGEPFDHRADQYALCAALWCSLRDLPGARGDGGELAAVVRRGLAADPAARFASVRELVAELRALPSVREHRRSA